MSDDITLAVADGVATLCLNRQEKRNAVTYDMWVAIGEYCRRLAGDAAVRVLVVRGAGAHFCAGADIAGLQAADHSYGEANLEAETALMAFPKPTIAFIQGVCVGGGVQIATSCDLRIADQTARFGITPARLGIIYPAPALARVVTLTGPAAAKHLLYSAELITAERALRIGLIDELHEPDGGPDPSAGVRHLAGRGTLPPHATGQQGDDRRHCGGRPRRGGVRGAVGGGTDEGRRSERGRGGVLGATATAFHLDPRRAMIAQRPSASFSLADN